MLATLTMPPVRENLSCPPTSLPSVDERERETANNKKNPLNQTCSNITTAASRKVLHCIEDKYGFSVASFMGEEKMASELDN